MFKVDECNDIPTKSIICEVKVKRISKNPITVAIDKEQYALITQYFEGCKNPAAFDFFDDDDEKDKPVTLRQKKVRKIKAVKSNTRKKVLSKKKPAKKVKKQVATGSKRKSASTKPAAKKPKLSVYAGSHVFEVNPVFDPKVTVPDVAPTVNFWKFIQSVKRKDTKALEQMISSNLVPSMGINYKMNECELCFLPTPWEVAIKNKDAALFGKLVNLSIKNKSTKCKMTVNLSSVSSYILIMLTYFSQK